MDKFEGSYSVDHNVRTLDREAHWLTFRSHPIRATVGIGASQGFKFEEFLITETLKEEPGDGSNSRRSYYQITFAYSVSSEANIDHAFTRFKTLRSTIEAVWHYAFGVPYDRNLTHSADSLAVEGWADNRLDILSNLKPSQPQLVVGIESEPLLEFRTWPLRRLIRALWCYKKEHDEAYKFLMDLHGVALRTENQDIRLTLFGKLAEVCEELLPGIDRKDKISRLPPAFKNRLVFDDRVFMVANTRLQTRHAINKKGGLHPSITKGESEDFQSDIDTLARFLVSLRFSLAPCFYEGWRFPKNCSGRWTIKVGKDYSAQRDAKSRAKDVRVQA